MKLCPDVVCKTAAGGPTGAATENTHGGMAQGTVEGEKRLKKMIHRDISSQVSTLTAERIQRRKAAQRPARQERSRQRQRGRGNGTPAGDGGGSSSQWQSLPRQRHQRSRHQRRSQFGDRRDGEQLASGGACRTSDVCFYLVPLSKRFH